MTVRTPLVYDAGPAGTAPTENLVPYSENPTLTFTITQTGVITLNHAPAPDGTTTAALLADTSTSVGSHMQLNFTIPDDDQVYTWSFYVKKDSNTDRFPEFRMNLFGGTTEANIAIFNTSTGAINTLLNTRWLSATVETVGDYWRIALTIANDLAKGNTGLSLRIDPAKLESFTSLDVTASLTDSIIFWGMQLEAAPSAGTYIRTPAQPREFGTSGFLRPVTPAELLEWQTAIIDVYAANPSSVLSVVSGSGTISPTMADTRLQAGAAQQGSDGFVSAFPNASQTGDVSTVTVNYDKVSGSFVTSNTGEVDSGYNFPLYYNEDNDSIQPMNLEDLVDSIIEPTIDLMVAATESDTTAGTYTISTSTSVTGYTEVSGANTAIYVDTRANADAYTAAGIPETQDQPTTINSYYLHRKNAGSTTPTTQLLHLDNAYADPTQQANVKDFDIRQYTIAEATTLLGTWLKVYAGEVSGYKITYSITTDGSGGNARGSGMVDTKLNGSGAFSTTLQDANDYRAQEFPNGSAATVTTYTLRVTKA